MSNEANPSDVAAALAHRACCGTEHDAQNGKLHGYCVVCGVPWPCETASSFLRPNPLQAQLDDRVRMLSFVQDQLTERNKELIQERELHQARKDLVTQQAQQIEQLQKAAAVDDDHRNIGAALMETLAGSCPTYSWMQCPTEIVVDMINEKHDAEIQFRQRIERLEGALRIAIADIESWHEALDETVGLPADVNVLPELRQVLGAADGQQPSIVAVDHEGKPVHALPEVLKHIAKDNGDCVSYCEACRLMDPQTGLQPGEQADPEPTADCLPGERCSEYPGCACGPF